MFNDGGSIGSGPGSTGAATVTGSGSTWTNGDHLTVGSLGTGMLDVVAGGAVSNADGYIGRSTGGTGIVTVTGAGSTWDQ